MDSDIIRKDGYINVTKLCKAGKKQFSSLNQLEKTKAFISLLSSKLNMSEQLIIYNKGSNKERAT